MDNDFFDRVSVNITYPILYILNNKMDKMDIELRPWVYAAPAAAVHP